MALYQVNSEDKLKGDCTNISTDPSAVHSVDHHCRVYGKHETQVSESEENLQMHFTNCDKNPGHTKFIPTAELTLQHLPEGYNDINMHTFIQVVADLTVRLVVSKTSPGRPELWPEKNIQYPFYDLRGSTVKRFGSGRVWYVIQYSGGFDNHNRKHSKSYTTCTCLNCTQADTPSNVWWELDVVTATHVIFDENEASHTSLRLFYDRCDSPLTTIDNVSMNIVNVADDRCHLRCVTCDAVLGNRLFNLVERYNVLWKSVYDKYEKYQDEDKMTFIVSHPHGRHKHVSFGQWMKKSKVGDDIFNHQFFYTTCTCPGSSGASVHIVGSTVGWWSIVQHVHSGASDDGLNFSGVGYVK